MEQELKFALTEAPSQRLEQQLARVPLIGRRKPQRQSLHNTYYDTPDHALHRERVALRVRQIGNAAQPQWVQTLKMGGRSDSALSQRGEWEHALAANRLDHALLAGTPWAALDPDGSLFERLEPVFSTRFERLSWIAQHADWRVEVALDRGEVQMDALSAPLCELEIELLSGPVSGLFDAAAQIGQHLALLPLHLSKAERAYRLAQGTLHAPLRAQPPALHADLEFVPLARCVLRETFVQFCANLHTVGSSDAPEVVHQARVGWRRFKSAARLFGQRSKNGALPALAPLQPLLGHLRALRDLEVAASDVFPRYAHAYQGDRPPRAQQWQRMQKALAQAIQAQRTSLRQALAQPAVGGCLLEITRWLETASLRIPKGLLGGRKGKPVRAAAWLGERLAREARQIKAMPLHAHDPALQHRLRIRSKRLRYGVESLQNLLPRKRAQRWHRQALHHQTRIGHQRDLQQALRIATELGAAQGIVDFMRGAAFGSLGGVGD